MTVSINGSSGIVFNDASTQNTSPFTGGFGFRNRIINGAMVIDQRNAGASVTVTTSNPYTVDRWQASASVSSKFTVQQTPSATETGYATRVGAGFTNYLACTSSSAYSVLAADYFLIAQNIEGLNTADLAWGTASASAVTLSFKVYSSLTGTFGGCLRNSAGNRYYPFSYTVSSANTWTNINITITGDTTGTWLTTNGLGIGVYFGLGVGSTYGSGTAGAWSGSASYAPTGSVSVVGTNGATFYITGVQLEKGSTATSFDYRPYGTELALCQRYLPYIGGILGNQSFGQCYANNTTTLRAVINFPVQARVYPTGLVTSTASGFVGQMQGSSNLTASALAITSIAGLTSILIELTVSGATAGQPGSIYNAGSGYMYFTGCEL